MFTQRVSREVASKWERIAAGAIDEIRRDQRLSHLGNLPNAELREWARDILTSLPSWPVTLDDEQLAGRYERIGQERFREAVPVYEAIRGLHLLKRTLIDFVRGEYYPQNALDLYAQIEFEHHTNMFFDQLMYHVARGHYEARQSVHKVA